MDVMSFPGIVELVKYVGYPALLFYIILLILRYAASMAGEIIAQNTKQNDKIIEAINETTKTLKTLSDRVITNQYCPLARSGENSQR